MDNPVFISDSQRKDLLEGYKMIERVVKQITIEHEEYTPINTSLYYLKNAIKAKEKFY
ncbi:hypothetical protein KGR20_24095 [Cytobacillus oceanisediminis]|jgi:hypothetical protein|uniref:hypothetical protein n=1 Tax=Cytobacillus oceanisediminis TaxID=665099 RepID=UPI001CCA2EA6|nr:hypothetical protein [Cytobacillus oceanisediminis]MBZ9537225.1 hypothetical protein [Cytobacillus oceanisediminis]